MALSTLLHNPAQAQPLQHVHSATILSPPSTLPTVDPAPAGKDSRPSSTPPIVLRGQPPPEVIQKVQGAFIPKLYSMVSSEWLAELIAWGYDGASFSVLNPQEFARSVLPQYFKHSNFQSFVRQLNIYGFHNVLTLRTTRWVHHPNAPGPSSGNQAEGPWEFKHPFFKRDSPELLSQVKRKSKTGILPSTPTAEAKSPCAAPSPASPAATEQHRRTSIKRSRSPSRSSGHSSDNSRASSLEPNSITSASESSATTRPTSGDEESTSASLSRGASLYGECSSNTLKTLGPAHKLVEVKEVGRKLSQSQDRGEERNPAFKRPALPLPPLPSSALPSLLSPVPSQPHQHRPTLPYPSYHNYHYQHLHHSTPYPELLSHPPSAISGIMVNPGESTHEAISRQLAGLGSQVSALADALYKTQQDSILERSVTVGVMENLLKAVVHLDLPVGKREQLEAAQFAISKFSGRPSTTTSVGTGSPYSPPPPSSSLRPISATFTTSAPWEERQPHSPPSHYSPRLLSESLSFSRPAPAESWARGLPSHAVASPSSTAHSSPALGQTTSSSSHDHRPPSSHSYYPSSSVRDSTYPTAPVRKLSGGGWEGKGPGLPPLASLLSAAEDLEGGWRKKMRR